MSNPKYRTPIPEPHTSKETATEDESWKKDPETIVELHPEYAAKYPRLVAMGLYTADPEWAEARLDGKLEELTVKRELENQKLSGAFKEDLITVDEVNELLESGKRINEIIDSLPDKKTKKWWQFWRR